MKEMAKKTKELLVRFCKAEDGMATVEIILILVVLVGLVLIFKDQIVSLVKSLLSTITKNSNAITG